MLDAQKNKKEEESSGTVLVAGQGRLKHASSEHPPIRPAKIGILIANLGTPDATDYWSMRRYLKEFLSDRRVIDYPSFLWQPILQLIILTKRPFSSGAAYRSIWNEDRNESPLLTIVRSQKEKLKDFLVDIYGEKIIVDFCMRYGNPSTMDVLNKMKEMGCEKIVFFPLYPQYAGPTTATANDEVFRTLMKMNWQPALRTVPSYYDNEKYISALASSVRYCFDSADKKPEHLVVSYHGVPERYLMQGDPYHCHCQKTTRLLVENLGWSTDLVTTAFQSKFGPEKWIGPATVDLVAELAYQGKKRIAVIAPAFSADCVETLEEINEEIKESFIDAGGEEFTYIPCLNDQVEHIEALASIVKNELSGWL
ncbi:MAG: ferrochelatase [Pseudomonadota bacterium]|nr:ferrochelatase [Pseudomonadota bacterium]